MLISNSQGIYVDVRPLEGPWRNILEVSSRPSCQIYSQEKPWEGKSQERGWIYLCPIIFKKSPFVIVGSRHPWHGVCREPPSIINKRYLNARMQLRLVPFRLRNYDIPQIFISRCDQLKGLIEIIKTKNHIREELSHKVLATNSLWRHSICSQHGDVT